MDIAVVVGTVAAGSLVEDIVVAEDNLAADTAVAEGNLAADTAVVEDTPPVEAVDSRLAALGSRRHFRSP